MSSRDGGGVGRTNKPASTRSDSRDSKSSRSSSDDDGRSSMGEDPEDAQMKARLEAQGWRLATPPPTSGRQSRSQDRRRPRMNEFQQPDQEQQPSDPQGYGQQQPTQRRVGPSISEYGPSGALPLPQMYGPLSQYNQPSAASDYNMQEPSSFQWDAIAPVLQQMPMQPDIASSDFFAPYQQNGPANISKFEFYGGVPQTDALSGVPSMPPHYEGFSQGFQPPPAYPNPSPYQMQGPSQSQARSGVRIQQRYCRQPECQNLPIFKSKPELAEHMAAVHPDVKWTCPQCDNDFDTELSFMRHEREANHAPGYFCRGYHCRHGSGAEQGYATIAERDAHIRRRHVFCPFRWCRYWTRSLSIRARIRHIEQVHPEYDINGLVFDVP